ncbi:ComF family protein [Streptomyces californicus]|uniref:ComF family protein n=1 Tax=Streptomyces californicus TaxID=67351 RepID=UPI0036DD45CC
MENYYGGKFDMLIPMPSHSSTRHGVGHLDGIIRCIKDFPSEWTTGALVKNSPSKADSRRARIVPELFTATAAVRGKRILLFDDTYTTGGSIASAAYALKQRGAVSVVGLTLGRQLRADWPDSKDFAAALTGRELNIRDCAVHGGRSEDMFDLFAQPG